MTTFDPKYKHRPSEKHTLEEVLKSLQDLIRNDLLDEKTAASAAEKPGDDSAATGEKPPRERTAPVREDFAPATPAAGPVNLDAVMRSLNDLIGNELNIGDEPSPPEQRDTRESASEEFTPLDEDLTFAEDMEIVPPPLAAPAMPELPGEISAELFNEPEAPAPPATPKPENEKKIAPGAQQELLFEEAPRLSPEHEPLIQNLAPEQEPEAAPETGSIAPEITGAPIAENPESPPAEALPTIEVEESFDESAYLAAEAQQAESLTPATQEIVAPSVESPAEPEIAPPTALSAANEEQTSAQDLVPAPEPESSPADTKITLEIASEPDVKSSRDTPSIDFDAIGLEPPLQEQASSSVTGEAPASEPAAPDVTRETAVAKDSPSAEIEGETKPTPEQTQALDITATPPATDEPQEASPATEPAPPVTPPPFNLDDIPVLDEVVAPPAGSALVASPPSPASDMPLPAPDRARDIVVRAVAKLNVEMRKSGGAGLDTKTILRLQQLIRQELEKDGEK